MATSLLQAARNGDINKIRILVEGGVNPDATLDRSITPLYIAVLNGREEAVRTLLKLGANVNERLLWGGDNSTALHTAVSRNNLNIVKILLDAHADPNLEDKHGYTPLFCAIQNDNINMAKLLIANGANINMLNQVNVSPLYLAAALNKPNMIKFLFSQPLLENPEIRNGKTITDLAREGKFRPEINELILKGQSSKERHALNKVIGSVPANLQGKVKENFGHFKKANTHVWNSIGKFIGPKTLDGGSRRRKTRAVRRHRRRTHKHRI